MRTLAASLCLFSLCLIPLGCGGPQAKAEKLIKKQIALTNELAELLEDGGSPEEIKEVKAEMKELESEGKGLDKELSEEERKELKTEYEEPMKEAMGRMMTAALKASPEQQKALSD